MQERLDKIENKIDKIADIQTNIQINLQEHIRRTAIAEENIKNLASAMQPVQEHVAFVKGFGKLVVLIATVAGGIAALWEVFIK